MRELGYITVGVIIYLVGMLTAFGLVLLFEFYGLPHGATLYGLVSTVL